MPLQTNIIAYMLINIQRNKHVNKLKMIANNVSKIKCTFINTHFGKSLKTFLYNKYIIVTITKYQKISH